MIIKLSNYDKKYRIAAFSICNETTNLLLSKNLNVMLFDNSRIVFLPENTSIHLTEIEKDLLKKCCEFDVFEIDIRGNAYKYYNSASIDNAILITNRCNSNCIMCPTAEIIRKSHTDYDVNTLLKIIKHFPDDAPHITITGGEPFLMKKDIFNIFNYLKENLNYTSYLLLTNGRAFCSKEYTMLFKESSPIDLTLGIPLHGYNADTHDKITQAPGSFNQTFIGLKNLLSIGARIELRIVISKLNAEFITKIAELITLEFKDIFCVKFIGLEMTGNAAKNFDNVWIDYPIAFLKSQNAINLLIENGIDVGIYNFPLCAVKKEYWNICEKSISDYKVRFSNDCDMCIVKDACGGIFSGTIRMAKEKIKPIRRYDD